MGLQKGTGRDQKGAAGPGGIKASEGGWDILDIYKVLWQNLEKEMWNCSLKDAYIPSEIIFEGNTLKLGEYKGCVLEIKGQVALIWWEAPGGSAGCGLNLK